ERVPRDIENQTVSGIDGIQIRRLHIWILAQPPQQILHIQHPSSVLDRCPASTSAPIRTVPAAEHPGRIRRASGRSWVTFATCVTSWWSAWLPSASSDSRRAAVTATRPPPPLSTRPPPRPRRAPPWPHPLPPRPMPRPNAPRPPATPH